MTAFWIAIGVVFLAELGDKSMLLVLGMAARFRPAPVLVGLSIVTLLLMAVSVAVGTVLGESLPTRAITIGSGVAFVGFGLWTLRPERADAHGEDDVGSRSSLVVACLLFGLSELGDKTNLATVALAATGDGWTPRIGTWLGASAGMIAADIIVIVIGGQLGRRLPERAIRIGSAVLFMAAGAFLLVDGVRSG